jgi:murein DD-endopeptidase MepM/ murein hydrolase activator NlpD
LNQYRSVWSEIVMGMPGFITKIRQRLHDEKHWLTRRKLFVFGATLILAGILLSIFEPGDEPERAGRPEIIDLSLPDRESVPEATQTDTEESASLAAPAGKTDWDSVRVKRGQTLDAIFKQQGLPIALLHQIIALNSETRGLTKIKPGETFDFQTDPSGEFLQMRYALDESRYLFVRNEDSGLKAELQQREIFSEVAEAEGIIQSSLFLAGKQAGMSDAMVMKLANIFGWDIDFVLDIRKGDRFMLVYEKIYREGEFLRDGNILAATFINQGQRFQAIYFEEGEAAGYFTPDGRNIRKAFLRAPLNFSYISSGFNPRRMHPILKRIRPHNGIDYYAPRGTPVYSAGAGTVTRSAYSRTNGHHVFVKHANSIETKYLHFTSRAVKKGQKVRQGQTIGFVGSTGLATGPHLHYEFVVNGVHRNPRTLPLPKVQPLKGALLASFQSQSAPMLTQLSRLESASLYASRE